MADVTYEILTKPDLDAALAIQCFGEEARENAEYGFGQSVDGAYSYYKPTSFVAKHKSEIVGVLQATSVNIHPNSFCFAWFAVLPAGRGKKIAEALLAFAEKEIAATKFENKPGTFLGVATINPRFHRPLGYRPSNLKTHDGHPYIVKHWFPPPSDQASQT